MGFSALLGVTDQAVRAALGQQVVYTPSVGSPVSIPGIFDASYIRIDDGTPGVSSSSPAVFVAFSDLPAGFDTDLGAQVTITGTPASDGVYKINEPQPDGIGGVVLILRLA